MRKWLPGLCIAAAYAFSAAVYGRLPARVATHWGTNGPNGWSSRAVAVLLVPTIALVVWFLMRWLPSIDPRRANYGRFQETYDAVVLAVVALLCAVHVAMLGAALGWPVRIERVVPIGVGILFVIIGALLPRARPTWFFGIRTPWTLTNDVAWERTHRVGGYVMILCGGAIIIGALIGGPWALGASIGCVALMTLGVYAYSYVVWKQQTSR